MAVATLTFFSKLQADTLDRLYEDVEEFWFFWLVLSDEVEDISPVAADGMRWLHRIRQRPWTWDRVKRKWKREKKSYPLPMHWWIGHQLPYADECQNYLPEEFSRILRSHTAWETEFPGPAAALSAFLEEWCKLTEETRHRLWREWRGG